MTGSIVGVYNGKVFTQVIPWIVKHFLARKVSFDHWLMAPCSMKSAS